MTLLARQKCLQLYIPPVRNGLTNIVLLLMCLIALTATAQTNLKTDTAKKKADSVVVKLKKARESLFKINTADKKAVDSKQVREELTAIKKRLSPIKQDLKVSKEIEPRRLDGYNVILKESQDKLGKWRKDLSKSGEDLQQSSKDLTSIGKDSLLKTAGKDSAIKRPYMAQLADVNAKLQQAGQSINVRLDTVNKLLTDVSSAYLEIADVQSDINDKLKDQNESALKQESPYIWSAPKETSRSNVALNLSSSYEGQHKLLNEFFASNWDNRTLAILFGIAFFMWIYFNYKKALKPEMAKLVGELDFKHIRPVPVIASLIFLLNLPPLFEPDSPALYIDIVQFALLLVLTLYFWKRLPKDELRHWLFVVFLYVVILITNDAVHNGIFMRLWLMAINLSSIYIGIVFYKKLQKAEVAEKYIKPVRIVYLTLNFLAIALNVWGRISLAKTFTVTAIIGITEVIALAIFIQVLTDALELQIKVSSCNGGLFSRINLSKTRTSFQRALSVIAVMLWLLVFLINLGIAQHVYDFFDKLISAKRTFGSISFTLGNIIFFSLILYISNIFQKHIGVLFGEKQISFSNQVEHKSSKLTLIRLVVAIIGVLMAVTASGIPIDKLTVVLGALSVGIGLGMQNIVNNFVSGIIIIFEKPFQIGDFVELADKKGKIQDIGIRASKMLTQQGSEVIIPNGDLVSNRFTNWTVNAAYVKSEILFKVNMSADISLVYKIIQEEITASDDAVKTMPPEILLNSIAADTVELRILAWINSIYVESDFKSSLFGKLITRFNQEQIKVM